jgi:hypothetical protein
MAQGRPERIESDAAIGLAAPSGWTKKEKGGDVPLSDRKHCVGSPINKTVLIQKEDCYV